MARQVERVAKLTAWAKGPGRTVRLGGVAAESAGRVGCECGGFSFLPETPLAIVSSEPITYNYSVIVSTVDLEQVAESHGRY